MAPKAYPIPTHIVAPGPRRDGHVLQVHYNNEVSKSAWVEVHTEEGWGIRLVTDSGGRIRMDPDKPGEVLKERVEGTFAAIWVQGNRKP